MASWSVVGGNRPSPQFTSGSREHWYMFDDDLSTFWMGYQPASTNNSINIIFDEPILFYEFVFYARPSVYSGIISTQQRYRDVCLYLDNILANCTTSDRQTQVGEKITLSGGVVTPVTHIDLMFPFINAAVAELQILYKAKVQIFFRIFGILAP